MLGKTEVGRRRGHQRMRWLDGITKSSEMFCQRSAVDSWFWCCANIFWSLHPDSVSQFSRSVVSNSLRLYGLQHARLPCSLATPGFVQTHVYRVSDAIQPSHPVIPFSSCLQSFPALVSFPMRQFFTAGGKSIGASALASVFPMNIQEWLPLGWTGLISFQSKALSRVFSTPQFKSINSSALSFLYGSALTSIHDY